MCVWQTFNVNKLAIESCEESCVLIKAVMPMHKPWQLRPWYPRLHRHLRLRPRRTQRPPLRHGHSSHGSAAEHRCRTITVSCIHGAVRTMTRNSCNCYIVSCMHGWAVRIQTQNTYIISCTHGSTSEFGRECIASFDDIQSVLVQSLM